MLVLAGGAAGPGASAQSDLAQAEVVAEVGPFGGVRPVDWGRVPRVLHGPGFSHNASLRRGCNPLLSENGF